MLIPDDRKLLSFSTFKFEFLSCFAIIKKAHTLEFFGIQFTIRQIEVHDQIHNLDIIKLRIRIRFNY
ncbi:hypothetical protein BpHYR1_041797 [Brachionus plicatilis]|uniref:Uncharacterized protein n=1 Tax=Brachionus plicatilis TaxID=10195 RepID=A0A3M7R0L1_BRAPC|nr:hypothetical protein BpHYR1_041797 [Brachionus plicatilis]